MKGSLRTACQLIVILAAVGAVFGVALNHEFLSWDDDKNVTRNALLVTEAGPDLARIWLRPYLGLYAPMAYTAYALESWVSQRVTGNPFHPAVFHATSVLLHALCALLVYLLLRGVDRRGWCAVLGALLFAVHPMQVESVAWVTEQRGLLCAFFGLLALVTRGFRGAYIVASLFYVAALLSKPAAIAIPLMLIVLERYGDRSAPRLALRAGFWLLLAGGFIAITTQAQSVVHPPPLWARPLVATDAIAFYMYKLVWPLGLAPDYGRSPRAAFGAWWIYATWIAPTVLVMALAVKRDRTAFAATGLFLAWTLPVLGLIPFAFQDWSTVADRYVYLAMLGPAFAVASWVRGGPRTIAVAVGVLMVLGTLSARQLQRWRDDRTLFEHTLTVNPHSVVAHNILGIDAVRTKRYKAAAYHFRRLTGMNPRYAKGYADLAGVQQRAGKLDAAARAYRRALALRARDPGSWTGLGNVHLRRGEHEKARRCYETALEHDPGYAPARANVKLLEQRAP